MRINPLNICILVMALLCSSCSVPQKVVEYLCQKTEKIARLDVGEGRKVLITAGVCWEISRPIYYEIVEDGRTVVPRSYLYGDRGFDDHQFTAIFAEGGHLVGVVETTDGKQDLIVMQDFRTGDSYPRVKDHEVSREEHVIKRHQSLFERLQKENPSLRRSWSDLSR